MEDWNILGTLRKEKDRQLALWEPFEELPERKRAPMVYVDYLKKYNNETGYGPFTLRNIKGLFQRMDFGLTDHYENADFIVLCVPVETLVNTLEKYGGEKDIYEKVSLRFYRKYNICIFAFDTIKNPPYVIPSIEMTLFQVHIGVNYRNNDEVRIVTHGGKITPQNILKRTL